MRAVGAVAGWLWLGSAAAQTTDYAEPASWAGAVGWEPNAAEWHRKGWNATARLLRFQPDVPVDVFAGRPFRLTLQDVPRGSLWSVRSVRDPLPSHLVAEVLGVAERVAGVVEIDLLAAATVQAGGDSGYLVVGYSTTRACSPTPCDPVTEYYTQPVAIKLYEPGEAISRGAAGSAAPIDDSEWGWAGRFFILFTVFDVSILVGLIGHYIYNIRTWDPPPESQEEPVGIGIGLPGGGKSQGAPSAQTSVY